jgi:hypothetical protein
MDSLRARTRFLCSGVCVVTLEWESGVDVVPIVLARVGQDHLPHPDAVALTGACPFPLTRRRSVIPGGSAGSYPSASALRPRQDSNLRRTV